jgi:hypothetical protein
MGARISRSGPGHRPSIINMGENIMVYIILTYQKTPVQTNIWMTYVSQSLCGLSQKQKKCPLHTESKTKCPQHPSIATGAWGYSPQHLRMCCGHSMQDAPPAGKGPPCTRLQTCATCAWRSFRRRPWTLTDPDTPSHIAPTWYSGVMLIKGLLPLGSGNRSSKLTTTP